MSENLKSDKESKNEAIHRIYKARKKRIYCEHRI